MKIEDLIKDINFLNSLRAFCVNYILRIENLFKTGRINLYQYKGKQQNLANAKLGINLIDNKINELKRKNIR